LLAYFLLFLLIWLAQLGDPSHDLGFKLNYVEIDLKWLVWLNESKHYSIVLFETWFNYKKLNKNDKIRREIWKKNNWVEFKFILKKEEYLKGPNDFYVSN
jgi:hypothetical protein